MKQPVIWAYSFNKSKRKCAFCGGGFIPNSPNQKYCDKHKDPASRGGRQKKRRTTMKKTMMIFILLACVTIFDGLGEVKLPGAYTCEVQAEEYYKYECGGSTRYVPHSGGDEIVVWNN